MNALRERPKVKIGVNYFHEGEIMCPFCHKTSNFDESIQEDDYVTCPMLWCNECGARSVFDKETFEKMNEFLDAQNEKISYEHKFHITDEIIQENAEKIYEFEIPLLFIERLSDHLMSNVKSDRELTPEEVKLLTNSYDYYKYDNNYNPEIVEKLGINFQEKCYDIDEDTVMNISVPVNSYNALEPEKEYDCNVDFSHDGVTICLLVVKLDGTKETIRYWGD